EVEPALDVWLAGRAEGLAVEEDVQPQQHRAVAAEEGEILNLAGRLALAAGGRRGEREGEPGQQARPRRHGACRSHHRATPGMGREPASAMRIGRPTLDIFCRVWSTPK